ncbi:MAG: ABC transporter permease [Myxococcota bacterium]|nr:ABC transporter permease [Myxococcota bacterium]
MLWNALRIALNEIRRNLSRSILTALGILIGVAAVIAMVGIGQGATASVEEDLASMGNNLLSVHPGGGRGPGSRGDAPNFKAKDAEAIYQQVQHVAAVAPVSSTSAQIVYAGEDTTTTVYGSTNPWFEVSNRSVASGRMPTETEQTAGAAVCLIGETTRETLFGGEAALGAKIQVNNMSCTVIGLLEAKGANTMGMDQDDLVFAPLTTVQRRLTGNNEVASIQVSADTSDNISRVQQDVTALMRERRHLPANRSDDFQVHDTREMAQMVSGITTTLTAFLGAVAGVSLLVGGIGVMNIMLVSVTERTREIGIRMAIGALERDVMTQFLVEASLLSAMGGVLGVLLGIGGSYLGAHLLEVPFVFNLPVVLIAVVFSALVGVGFGWYPARRAARMEPIDALRH